MKNGATQTDAQRRAMFARLNAGRSQGAINRDLSVRAADTLPNTPENVKLWKQNPRRIDIEGIDTPIDMKTVLIIQSAKPYPDDLKIGSREEFYDENFWYDPKRGRHPASGSGRLPTKHVPFYEVVDVDGKSKWKVVNPYTGEIKYYPYGEHNAVKAYYDGLYDDYLKSEGAPSAPTEFKADASLLNKELLRNAHSGTSFDPEKRAETEKEYFKAEVNDVYNELKGSAKTEKHKSELEDEMLQFQKKYAEKFNDTLASRGRMLSPMIAGPANFPTRRNEKAYNSYENKVRENAKFRDKVVAGITKRWRKENVADAGGARTVLEKKLKKAQENHQQMKDINVIMRKKSSDSDKRKQLESIGVSETLIRDVFKPDYMGRTGFQGFHLQNSNAKIKSMKERLKTMSKFESTETTSKEINGVEIVDNKESDRVQILFDGKPDEVMRNKLKGSGWRWSPKNTAWQRKRTDNAMRSAEQIVKGD